MEVREKRVVNEFVGYTCDICNQPCYKEHGPNRADSTEHALLRAEWGYWSDDKDLTVHECHMCEACYNKVRTFIEHELKGTVRVTEISPTMRPDAGGQ